jgi:hypothetical protein
MKISEALDQLLRSTRKAENGKDLDGSPPAQAGKATERPLPNWVQRSNVGPSLPETPAAAVVTERRELYDPPPLRTEAFPVAETREAENAELYERRPSSGRFVYASDAVEETETEPEVAATIVEEVFEPETAHPTEEVVREPEPAVAAEAAPRSWHDDTPLQRVAADEVVAAPEAAEPEAPEPEPAPAPQDAQDESGQATENRDSQDEDDHDQDDQDQDDQDQDDQGVPPDVALLTTIFDQLSTRVRVDPPRTEAEALHADTDADDDAEPAPTATATELPSPPPGEEQPDEQQSGSEVVPFSAEFAHLEAGATVAESLNLGYHLGSVVERVVAAAGQGSEGVTALREAAWLIDRYIALLEKRPIGADLHLSATRLARTGDAIAGVRALAAAFDEKAAPADPEPEPAEEATTTTGEVSPMPGSDEPEPSAFGRIRRLSPESPE